MSLLPFEVTCGRPLNFDPVLVPRSLTTVVAAVPNDLARCAIEIAMSFMPVSAALPIAVTPPDLNRSLSLPAVVRPFTPGITPRIPNTRSVTLPWPWA